MKAFTKTPKHSYTYKGIKPISIWLLLFLVLRNPIFASDTIQLADHMEEFSVTRKFVEYFEDNTSNMSFGTIKNTIDPLNKFKISTKADLVNTNKSSAYWLKFILVNRGSNQGQFIIEMFDFDIDEISLYFPDSMGVYKEYKAGFKSPFSFRKIGHKNVSFPLPFKSTKPVTVYMRFKSQKLNVLEPMIRSYHKYINYGLNEYILLGIFYGLLLLIILYNLLYFIILQKYYYLYYVIYASAVLLHLLGKNGTGFQYLWNSTPWLNDYIPSIGLCIASLSMLVFFIDFFELKQKNFEIYKVLCLMLFLRIAYFVVQVLNPRFQYHDLIDIVYFQIVFFFGTKLYRSGLKSTKWFIVAYSILNCACIIKLLEHNTFIPSNIFTVYVVNIGVTLQFIFLSIGIAETVRQIYKDNNEAQGNLIVQYRQNEILKEKVNRELEEKVKERTKELQKAKLELEKRAEENQQMNLALDLANNKLQKYINTFAKDVVMNTHVDFEAFKKAYPDDLACMRYLHELKEKSGFCCKKCGQNKAIKGKATFDIRCAKCNYNESLTAHTIFHKTKFALQKAYYMLYLVSQTKTDISATELSKILELQKATCQNFKNKILERMAENSKKSKLKTMRWDYLILDHEISI